MAYTDDDLARMGLRDALKWAADDNGRLVRDRLLRVASARRYNPRWVSYWEDEYWENAHQHMCEWGHRKREQRAL